ncbi:MAG TPA: hypothetical protein DEP62_02560 [Flavobacteriales bacterium]|jgi:hypothetical protein|nr:hypothetical protein [Crocinitomicaceae bacterium]HCC64071.1 hypothetical protein [Flavobacteriales bacterium]
MKKLVHLGAFMLALLLSACHTHEDSATMKEARAVNEETNLVARSFEQRAEMVREDLTTRMGMDETPEEVKGKMEAVLSQLDELESQYQTWMSDQVLLPGATCNHDHADGEHHHHHTSLDDLSDEDHLELQKAIRAELDKLVATLNGLHL